MYEHHASRAESIEDCYPNVSTFCVFSDFQMSRRVDQNMPSHWSLGHLFITLCLIWSPILLGVWCSLYVLWICDIIMIKVGWKVSCVFIRTIMKCKVCSQSIVPIWISRREISTFFYFFSFVDLLGLLIWSKFVVVILISVFNVMVFSLSRIPDFPRFHCFPVCNV
jgi:hypothetical protein